MSSYEKVIAALECNDCIGSRAQYQCPAHDDGTPSLTVTDKGDRVLVHSHACCDPVAILDALALASPDLLDNPARANGWPTSTTKTVGAKVDGYARAQLGGARCMPGGTPKTLAVKAAARASGPIPPPSTVTSCTWLKASPTPSPPPTSACPRSPSPGPASGT